MEWEAFEHIYQEKTADWFWAVGIIVIGITVTAILLGNLLFAVLILISGFALVISAVKKPDLVRFGITERGITIEDTLYPYTTLESFWIEEPEAGIGPAKLLIKSEKLFMPHIVIPLTDEIDTEILRDLLLEVMKEEEHHEPAAQKLMEYLGF